MTGEQKTSKFYWYGLSRRYYDGPSCTTTKICWVLKKIKMLHTDAYVERSHKYHLKKRQQNY